jgi:hypothetical protein
MLLCGLIPATSQTSAATNLSPSFAQCSAPVIIAVTPSNGNASIPQDLLLSGSGFRLSDGTVTVTSVFAVEAGNPGNVIQASAFVVLNANLIDVLINFGAANSCKTFNIFVNGPCGPSAQGPVFITSCPTPAERISALKDRVTALEASGDLTRKQAKSLIKNLDQALDKLANGNTQAAVNKLNLFINKLERLTLRSAIPPTMSNPLITEANSIINQIESSN